jgi:hypothetical protein
MQPNIPITTDNLYKFIALFGLVLFISSGITLVYSLFYHNKLLHEHSLELAILNAKTVLSSEETVKKEFLSHVRNLNISNRRAFFYIITIIAGIGIGMMLYGLKKWHQEIHPQQYELLNLQIEKMKLEIIELENKVMTKEVE